jgi:hypothetical protein
MAEHAEEETADKTEDGGLREGLGEGMREMREDISLGKVEGRLDEAVEERPVMKHLLDLSVVLKAIAIAAVLTLILVVIGHPRLGAAVLVISFIASWLILATRQYNKRRPTKPVGEDDDADGDDDDE